MLYLSGRFLMVTTCRLCMNAAVENISFPPTTPQKMYIISVFFNFFLIVNISLCSFLGFSV